jgi:hypothetical protein
MVSITRQPIKIPDECGLPQELVKAILEKADMCEKVIKLTDNGISVFDFNTQTLIRNIKSKYYFKLSVSMCGIFAVGSNEHYPVDIWNINTGLAIKIEGTFENYISTPLHTFSLNNELLVTYKNSIYSYEFSEAHDCFIINHVYKIPDEHGVIIYITHNKYEHTFACALDSGKVYIFNSLTKTIISHDISINLVDDYIMSLTFAKKILFVVANDIKLIFNLTTGSNVMVQKPKTNSRSVLYYINISEFYLLPCLTKAIGFSHGLSLIWDVKTGRIIKRVNMSLFFGLNATTPEGTKLVSCDRHKDIINIIDLINL